MDDVSPLVEWRDESNGDSVSLTKQPIKVEEMIKMARSPHAGAVSSFLGTTRNTFQGLEVTSLEYEAYDEMAIAEMRKLVEKIRGQWNVTTVVVQHKIGNCPVGEVSVLIAVSSEHRKESLEAVDFAINELKRSVPIWKKECYADGEASWKANAEFVPTPPIVDTVVSPHHPTSEWTQSSKQKEETN